MARRVLAASDRPLQEAYDLAMLDLDGVVYVGPNAVPGAPDHLGAAAEAGMRLAYVTNNAARPPAAVAEHLVELGIPCRAQDVVTSAQAAARLVAEQVPAGAAVFVIGGQGLVEALAEHGLVAVQKRADGPVAVVSGYHPDLAWRTVIAGAILVKEGLPWVASNTDLTVPTPDGPGPGNGVLVRAVAEFSERTPVVAGKPEPPLFHETRERVGGSHPLVVGDRLDTDIEGAVRAGYDSLLVMTGVTDLSALLAAGPESRPTFLAADLGGLATTHESPDLDDGTVTLGGWSARVDDGRLRVTGAGSVDDWWRTVARCAWDHRDASGEVVEPGDLTPPAAD